MTYDELQALIRAQVDENPAVQQIAQFFEFAEGWFDDMLSVREAQSSATIAVSGEGNERIAPLPADYHEARQVSSTQNPPRVLQATTPDEIVALSPLVRDPLLYAVIGQNMFIAPSGVTEISLLYYTKIPRLSASMQTNWLSIRRPDLYYYRVLFEMAAYMNQADKAAAYEGKTQQIIEEMHKRDIAATYRNATVRVRTPVA